MSFLDHIRACNAYDLSRFRPFSIDGHSLGWLRRDFAALVAKFPDVFDADGETVHLSSRLQTPEQRTEAVHAVVDALAADGLCKPRRGEQYPVAPAFGRPPLMLLDRAVVVHFGVRAYGLHVNGYVRRPSGLALWIGTRAKDKPVAPGKLDNIIAGGQPAGLTLAENLRKEAKEEADLPDALIDRCVPVGALSYCFENEHGLKPDTLFIYDLELPAEFTPRNTDGEIDAFHLMPVEEVAERVRTTDDFKFNVNLVITDFLIRHGLLQPDAEPDYLAIVQGLRQTGP